MRPTSWASAASGCCAAGCPRAARKKLPRPELPEPGPAPRRSAVHELKITGGQVVDGTGAPPGEGEVAVNGGRITEVAADVGPAREVIAAEGHLVTPGFVDPHSHACGQGIGAILHAPTAPSAILQGVTALVTGMCGYSPLEIGAHYDAVAQQGAAVNYALLIGHNTVRQHVMEQRAQPPAELELQRMRGLVRAGMEQGALGLSSGLGYVPGAYAETDELVELAREVAPFGGLYASHIRSEDAQTGPTALDEAIEIGREAGVPVQVAHLKAAERPAWGQGRQRLERLERAQAEGLQVHADAYPYDASATGLAVCLPPEAFESPGLKARLEDPANARRYREHIAGRLERVGGADHVLITAACRSDVAGKRLDDAARVMGVSPEDAVLSLVLGGSTSAIYFAMDHADVDAIVAHPLVMIGSDSSVRRPGEGICHPRTWGTFPRVLARYVRDLGTLHWGGAVHKMTGQAAAKFGLRDR
ncbi:MAG: amidohydrolase family protein, partial [Armatimonadetes bacterium]|nr:amidohydrolase family protein [Armatimonadota bacterium]